MTHRQPFPVHLVPLLLLLAACGATGDPAGDPGYMPVAGTGPFQKLMSSPTLSITAPFVLTARGADLDEPSVLATSGSSGTVVGPSASLLSLWVSVRRGMVSDIERAGSDVVTAGFGALSTVLTADAPWELGSVAGPSPVPPSSSGEPWLLFYSAGGALGSAISTDGQSFTKAPGPSLIASAEEGATLGAPSAVRIGDRVRVYYTASGKVWAAEAPFSDLAARRAPTWTRVDGNPDTAARDPLVDGAPWANGTILRVYARAAATPAGRLRHDLFFDDQAGPLGSIAWAASYDGVHFTVAALPVLVGPARAPAVVPYGDGALCLYVDKLGDHSVIGAALSP